MSALLQKNRIDAPHELVGSEGIVSANIAAFKCSYHSSATRGITPQEAWGRRTHAFHQVRAPLPAIRSIAMVRNWDFINRWCPGVVGAPRLIKAMRYWYVWNRHCHEVASWGYRVESFPGLCKEYSRRLGRTIQWGCGVSTTFLNTRKHLAHYPAWTEADLWKADAKLTYRILEQAKQYGYRTLSG